MFEVILKERDPHKMPEIVKVYGTVIEKKLVGQPSPWNEPEPTLCFVIYKEGAFVTVPAFLYEPYITQGAGFTCMQQP